jgi:hypothetical protein
MFDGGPSAFRPLAVVKRVFTSDALPPTINAIAVDGQQKNTAAESAFEAGLEKMHQWHLDFTEGDGFNFHIVDIHSPK